MSHYRPIKILIQSLVALSLTVFDPVFAQTAKEQAIDATPAAEKNAETEEIPFEKLLEQELSNTADTDRTKPEEGPNWAYQIFKTIIGLGFILFVIFLFRRYILFKNRMSITQTGIITTLHEYPVGTGKKLRLIEVGNKVLLIGISESGIELISEFKEKASIDQIKLAVDSQSGVEATDFWIETSKAIAQKIRSMLSGKKSTGNFFSQETGNNWTSLQENARNRINELREKKKSFEDKDDTDETSF